MLGRISELDLLHSSWYMGGGAERGRGVAVYRCDDGSLDLLHADTWTPACDRNTDMQRWRRSSYRPCTVTLFTNKNNMELVNARQPHACRMTTGLRVEG